MGSNVYSQMVIKQGATFNTLLTWYSDKARTTLVNLTGYTARMHLRRNVEDAAAYLTLTTENSRIVLGGAAGTIQLTVSAADTAALAVGKYAYDLELVNGSVVTRLVEGTIDITREITR